MSLSTEYRDTWLSIGPGMSPTLDIRLIDKKNQGPQQRGGGCLRSSQEQIQRAQSQIGLSEAQLRVFVLFKNAEKIQW